MNEKDTAQEEGARRVTDWVNKWSKACWCDNILEYVVACSCVLVRYSRDGLCMCIETMVRVSTMLRDDGASMCIETIHMVSL